MKSVSTLAVTVILLAVTIAVGVFVSFNVSSILKQETQTMKSECTGASLNIISTSCTSSTGSIIWTTDADFGRGAHTSTANVSNDLILSSIATFYDSKWAKMSPPTFPRRRYDIPMVYDLKNNLTIMFGGYGVTSDCDGSIGNYCNGTWAYNYTANNWTQMNPPTYPLRRAYHSMVYDSQNNLSILFGGSTEQGVDDNCDGSGVITCNGTWVYNYTANNWTKMEPPMFPSGRMDPAMAYDSQNNLTILFGGRDDVDNLNDTWIYNYTANNWTNVTPQGTGYVSPSARRYLTNAMVYDSKNNITILFGGLCAGSGCSLGDTWIYNYTANNWTNVTPQGTGYVSPSARSLHSMVYDSQNNITVLFGGFNGTRLNDTWIYNYTANNWTLKYPLTALSARYGSPASYDFQNKVTVLFGGTGVSSCDGSGVATCNGTWIYNYTPFTETNYSSSGSYLSNITNLGTVAFLTANWNKTNTTPAQNITIELSTDGTTWLNVSNNTQYSSGYGAGSDLRYRANLSTDNASLTPYLHGITLEYRTGMNLIATISNIFTVELRNFSSVTVVNGVTFTNNTLGGILKQGGMLTLNIPILALGEVSKLMISAGNCPAYMEIKNDTKTIARC